MSWPKSRRKAAFAPLSMLNTRSTRNMPAKLGVDLDELLISQPDIGRARALEIVDTLVRSGAVSMVVVDSVAALTPKSELEGDMGDSSVGVPCPSDVAGHAQTDRLYQPFELHGDLHQPDSHENRPSCSGSPETTTGGNALKF